MSSLDFYFIFLVYLLDGQTNKNLLKVMLKAYRKKLTLLNINMKTSERLY